MPGKESAKKMPLTFENYWEEGKAHTSPQPSEIFNENVSGQHSPAGLILVGVTGTKRLEMGERVRGGEGREGRGVAAHLGWLTEAKISKTGYSVRWTNSPFGPDCVGGPVEESGYCVLVVALGKKNWGKKLVLMTAWVQTPAVKKKAAG